MSGTVEGGKRAAATNKALYGRDYYKRLGHKGGSAGTTGGFWGDSKRAKQCGSIGGKKSRRGFKLISEDEEYLYYRNKETGKAEKVAKHEIV